MLSKISMLIPKNTEIHLFLEHILLRITFIMANISMVVFKVVTVSKQLKEKPFLEFNKSEARFSARELSSSLDLELN